jgi:hypothetical protein
MLAERACVYTVLFGQFEDLLEQPVAADSGTDFLCFTDDPELRSDSWQIRLVQRAIPGDPARSSRYPKICAHRFLQDYDVSMYIDNSVLLTRSPEEILDALLPASAGLAAMAHSFRETVRDEFRAVIAAKLDAEWVCEEQLEHYRLAYPDVLDLKPLVGGVLLRRHLRADVIEAMEVWWFNVLRYSRRDQLSFRVALAETSFDLTIWSLDIKDSGYWKWPVSRGRNLSSSGVFPFHSMDRESEIEDLARSVAEFVSETRRLAGVVERQERESEQLIGLKIALDERISQLDSTNETLRLQYDAIRASRSWRLTSGLRSMEALVRRAGSRRKVRRSRQP